MLFRISLLLSAALLAWLLYGTPRSQFGQLLLLFAGLFALYGFQLGLLRRQDGTAGAGAWIRELWWSGAALRLLACFALPALSDDYFRFVWDGRLLAHGVNPFLRTPEQWMQSPAEAAALGLDAALYAGLNSKAYFTIYPPLLQGIFYLAVRLAPDSVYGAVLGMKACILAAELCSLWLLLRLLRRAGLPESRLGLYALNPLVIAELCGSLHFEALMIACLLAAVWLLERRGWAASAAALAGAMAAKLLPLMVLPLLIRRIGWRKAFGYGAAAGGLLLLMFLPLYDPQLLRHLSESVGLYFRKFEFNASLYYLIRWAGYEIRGYNVIQIVGKYLAAATALGILLLAALERKPQAADWARAMLWAFLIYLSLSAIVHPWYVTTLAALSYGTRYRFAVWWTALLPLSYAAYQTAAYQEPLGLTALAYGLLAGWLLAEWAGLRPLGRWLP
ncbi:MAG: hypothetical protein NW241_08280 [Bacteroidia bacterium]|nr:hypothetical protein [Bacteroidia bacterium]